MNIIENTRNKKYNIIIWALITSGALLFFENWYVFSYIQSGQNYGGLGLLFLVQTIFIVSLIKMCNLLYLYGVKWKNEPKSLSFIEKAGSGMMIFSVLLLAAFFSNRGSIYDLALCKGVAVSGLISIGIGIYQYCVKKRPLTMIFILWGICLNLLLYIMSFIFIALV